MDIYGEDFYATIGFLWRWRDWIIDYVHRDLIFTGSRYKTMVAVERIKDDNEREPKVFKGVIGFGIDVD